MSDVNMQGYPLTGSVLAGGIVGVTSTSEEQVTLGSKVIAESLDNLASTITRLEDRLEAVLRPHVAPADSMLKEGGVPRSRLAEELHGHSVRATDLTIRLQTLLSRIDL